MLVEFLQKTHTESWESKHQIPREIKDQLTEVKTLLNQWSGRPFVQKASQVLHSDSSTNGWGGLDVKTGKFVQEFWREKSDLHINVKEMAAAINTVKSLGKKGETICLCVDNQVIYYYLSKGGGKKNPLN